MNFRKTSINSREQKSNFAKKAVWAIAGVFVAYYIIRFIAGGADLQQFVFSFGTPLQTDKNGQTNFLFVGTGGEMHEGADLTDSILVTSLDTDNNSATIFSIPRDLYVDTMIDGEDRINKIYTLAKNKFKDSTKAMEILDAVVEKALGKEIHYYVKINFEGFADVIDMIGGVDLYVEETIDDPFYPLEGTIKYEPFHLSKGLHHLDGETSLKYARSRKTTSDFDRSHRQQKLLFAIKDEMVKQNISQDPDKIKEIFLELKDNIETNLSIREAINLADVGKEVKAETVTTYMLHDDPSKCGGFLYTPERTLYGGAFVLIPASDPVNREDNYKYLNFFTREILGNPEIGKENIEIQILNGTGHAGLAGQTKSLLTRNCFNTNRFGNAEGLSVEKTKIYAKTEKALNSKTIQVLHDYLGTGEITTSIPPQYVAEPYLSDAEIVIELGNDYAENPNIDPFDYLVDMEMYQDPEAEAEDTGDSAEGEEYDENNTETLPAEPVAEPILEE